MPRDQMTDGVTLTEAHIVETFAEWRRRDLQHPEQFADYGEMDPREYGESCAETFLSILAEVTATPSRHEQE